MMPVHIESDFPVPLPLGTKLQGRYQVMAVLGQGGFGITYKVEDATLNRVMAIKELYPWGIVNRKPGALTLLHVHENEFDGYVKRFMAEIQTLAKMPPHPNIVEVVTSFEENATAYFVMPYYEGETFEHYIKQNGGTLSETAVMNIMRPILEGLQVVHEHDLIHRDIKPQNIYIVHEENGGIRPLLLDFGAARSFKTERPLTRIFTPGFGAPEQIALNGQKQQGEWTDLYACAATIFYALTGVYYSDDSDKLWDLPDLSDALRRALVVTLTNDPKQRPQNIAEFLDKLTFPTILSNIMDNRKNLLPKDPLFEEVPPEKRPDSDSTKPFAPPNYLDEAFEPEEVSVTSYVPPAAVKETWAAPSPLDEEAKVQEALDPKMNYVLFLGPVDSGKTVIFSSLIYYLRTKGAEIGRLDLINKDRPSLLLFKELRDMYNQGRVMDRTTSDRLWKLRFTFSPLRGHGKVRPLSFTVLDASGEHLNNLDLTLNEFKLGLGSLLDDFIQKKIRICFVITIGYQQLGDQSRVALVDELVQYLKEKGMENHPLMFLVTQWDRTNTTKPDNLSALKQVIQKHMWPVFAPLEHQFPNAGFGYYTIGRVEENNGNQKPRVTSFTLKPAEALFYWIYQQFNGHPYDTPPDRPWWKKMLS